MPRLKTCKFTLVILCLSAASLILTACQNNLNDQNSDSQLTSDLDHNSANLTRPANSNKTAQEQEAVRNEASKKPIKITNPSSSSVNNVSVSLSGNLKGVNIIQDGCSGQVLAADNSCKFTIETTSNAQGSGNIQVSGDGAQQLDIKLQIGSAYITASNTTATQPNNTHLIKIHNRSAFPAFIDVSNLKLKGDSTDHITIQKNDQSGDSCFALENSNGFIRLGPDKHCDIPIKLTSDAQGHASISLSGNFFHKQYIPINVAPVLAEYTKDNGKITQTRFFGSLNQTKNLNITRDTNKDTSQFKLNNIEYSDKPNHVSISNLSEPFSIANNQTESFNLKSDNQGIDLLHLVNAQGGDNLSDNIDPFPTFSKSNVLIYPRLRQNLEARKQTSEFANVILFNTNNATVNSIELGSLQISKKAPLKGEKTSQAACQQALNNDESCIMWVKPTALSGIKQHFASIKVSYKSGNTDESIKALFSVRRNLVATGSFQVPPTSPAQIKPTQTSASEPSVDNGAIMRWDFNGLSRKIWRWNQGGNKAFGSIQHALVNPKGQLCVDGEDDGDYSFACYNGYKWLINNKSLPNNQSNFIALRSDPNAPRLLALPKAKPKQIYQLSYGENSNGSWGKILNPGFKIDNFMMLNTIGPNNSTIVVFTKQDTNDQAQVYHETVANQGDNTPQQIGSAIPISRPNIQSNDHNHYRLALREHGNKETLYIAGQENGAPVVYKNTFDGQSWDNWTSLAGPNVSGLISDLTVRSDGEVIITLITNNQTQGAVYRYKKSNWQQLGDKTDPVNCLFVDEANNEVYIGTQQFDSQTNSTKPKNEKSSVVLKAKDKNNVTWSSFGNLTTQVGKITQLTPLNRMTIADYES